MVKYKELIFAALIIFFLAFSFAPTVFELTHAGKLADPNREFILEHNYYWPDYNLYLSKIREGYEGRLTALERYTSERHSGSLIQEFYVILGFAGRILHLDPNAAYLLGRIILSPLLLLVILLLVIYFFPSLPWQIIAFLIIVTSGSFPRFYTDSSGLVHIGRFMEWWSNIDALQRITFIPHILFGQIVSLFLLYKLAINNKERFTKPFRLSDKLKLTFFILLGNFAGLVFPPSLITLDSVLFGLLLINLYKTKTGKAGDAREGSQPKLHLAHTQQGVLKRRFGIPERQDPLNSIIFIILSLPSLIYIYIITKQVPWSSLVIFHQTHPMLIPFGEYILGTGPVFILGLAGMILSVVKRKKKFLPLTLWILATFFFAVFFTHIREQSPLRFTQTGLFIPLGILGAYFFMEVWNIISNAGGPRESFQSKLHLATSQHGALQRRFVIPEGQDPPTNSLTKILLALLSIFILFYILENLFMMKVSLDWQSTWISQRIGANIPPVPYPPQTMYPLKAWMDGIRWLRDNTDRDDVVLAEITAGNYIPAYSGNTVYFGQSNTVDYDRKQLEVDDFFKGNMNLQKARDFLKTGRISYIFDSIQEKDLSGGKTLDSFYPFLSKAYSGSLVTIYKF